MERVRLLEIEMGLKNTNPIKTKSSWTLSLITGLVGFGLNVSIRRIQ